MNLVGVISTLRRGARMRFAGGLYRSIIDSGTANSNHELDETRMARNAGKAGKSSSLSPDRNWRQRDGLAGRSVEGGGPQGHGLGQNVYPPMSTELEQMGIPFAQGYRPENLSPQPDIVVVGNAISRGNPELEEVLIQKLRYTSAAATIKEEFIWGRHSLAVAGTHGKTTTTSLLAWVLESAGFNPSFLIGGVAREFRNVVPAHGLELFRDRGRRVRYRVLRQGSEVVHYLPDTAIVNNIEFDHADIYRDEEAYKFAFARFINLIPKNGVLVAGWDSPLTRELAPKSFAPVESFAYWGRYANRRPVSRTGTRARFSSARAERPIPRIPIRRKWGRGRDAACRRVQRPKSLAVMSCGGGVGQSRSGWREARDSGRSRA